MQSNVHATTVWVNILLGGHEGTAGTNPAQFRGHDVPPSCTCPACEPWPPLCIATAGISTLPLVHVAPPKNIFVVR